MGPELLCISVRVCVSQRACIYLCLWIIWINTHRKELFMRRPVAGAEAASGTCAPNVPLNPPSFPSAQQTNLSTSISSPPPGHDASSLSTYCRLSICSFSQMSVFHHSNFFLPVRAFKLDLCALWRIAAGKQRLTVRSEIGLSDLRYYSLLLNDATNTERDFIVAGDFFLLHAYRFGTSLMTLTLKL